MSALLLDRAGALSPGSQLWIVPDLAASAWSCKIDWYLNFSILRSLSRQPQTHSENLQEIMSACELDFPPSAVMDDSPIMIDCQNRLPAKWVVVVPTTSRIETWINRTYHIWNQLKRPPLRIFIAKDYPADVLTKNWGQLAINQQVTLVPAQLTS